MLEEPLKIKICSQTFLLPISFLQNIFASQYSFLPPNDILLAKNSPKLLLVKFPPQKNLSCKTCSGSPKFPPKKSSFKKIYSPFCSPNFHPKEFAPQIFPLKNLLPYIFAFHVSSHNEILLTKIPPKYFCWRNFPLTRISPPKLSPQYFLPRKFALKRNCSPYYHPPPPPKKKKKKNNKFSKECAHQIFPPQKIAAKIVCSPYYFSQKTASQILLPKHLCCSNHFVEQLCHLINTGAVVGYCAVPAALLLKFCHLLKDCDFTVCG